MMNEVEQMRSDLEQLQQQNDYLNALVSGQPLYGLEEKIADLMQRNKALKGEVERLHTANLDSVAVCEQALQAKVAAEQERDQLKAQINSMKQAIDDLVRNSEGVAGLHQNGEMAPWDELLTGGRFEEWLAVFDETPEQSLAARDAEVIENLQFPTVFRKMWSGSEVQAWLNEEANLIRQQAKESQHE